MTEYSNECEKAFGGDWIMLNTFRLWQNIGVSVNCEIVFGGDCFDQFVSDFDDHSPEFSDHWSELDDHWSEFDEHSSKSVAIDRNECKILFGGDS